jgi:hypothetical protein
MKTNECKVKIGSAYEPKWFERRQTSGWYSGKNPPLDQDAMWLQSSLLGTGVARLWKTKLFVAFGLSAFGLYAAWCYGVFT